MSNVQRRNKSSKEVFLGCKIFIFFLLGSIFGFVFEGTISFFIDGKWMHRSDLIYGPFSTLYGVGVVLNLALLLPKNQERGIFKTFILSSIIGGTYEYFAGFLAEAVLDIKFWDYSKMILNINGRTTIPIMIAWGVFGTVLLKLFYPFLSKWIEKIPQKITRPLCVTLLILIIINMCISYSAFGRMILRRRGEGPKTFIGKIYDKKFDDNFMYKRFPILKGKL